MKIKTHLFINQNKIHQKTSKMIYWKNGKNKFLNLKRNKLAIITSQISPRKMKCRLSREQKNLRKKSLKRRIQKFYNNGKQNFQNKMKKKRQNKLRKINKFRILTYLSHWMNQIKNLKRI